MNTVFTAIFGMIDRLKPVPKYPGWRFLCYTDRDCFEDRGWEIIPMDPKKYGGPRRCARTVKTQPCSYAGGDVSLWIDGCLSLRVNPDLLVENHLKEHDLAVFKHAERSCVYQELTACLRLRKDDPLVMRTQVAKYSKEGYPPNNGLGETTAVLSFHTKEICQFHQMWHREIQFGSLRDQLSFDYCCWKLGIKYAHLTGSRTKSPYFKWKAHR